MHIEELSKSQLILLTILVNFVTSIATGILTVSLLDHAPPYVTQTVNRVVEHTIQTVTQAAPAAVVAAPAPSTQDLVTSAIAADATRIVTLFAPDAGTSTPALAVGTYLPEARAVVTASLDSLPKEVSITFADGSTFAASLSRSGKGVAIYGFGDDAVLPKVTPPKLLTLASLKLGETVLAVTADGAATTGIVSRVGATSVYTTLPNIGTGSAAVDLSGNLIGIASGAASGALISAEVISAVLTATTTAATSTSAS
jgi:hypothetical protein